MNYYTLILNKASGYNTCRCCVMERWHSDFSIDVEISEDVAINRIADVFAKKFDGGSYTAHLVGTTEEKRDYRCGNDLISPSEQVVYEFEQYREPDWKREDGGVRTLSCHYYDNGEEIDADGKRIDQIIRSKVEQLKNKFGTK